MVSIEGLRIRSLKYHRGPDVTCVTLPDVLVLGETLGMLCVRTNTGSTMLIPLSDVESSIVANAGEEISVDRDTAKESAGDMWVDPWSAEGWAEFISTAPPPPLDSSSSPEEVAPELTTRIVDPNPPSTSTAEVPEVSSAGEGGSTVDASI